MTDLLIVDDDDAVRSRTEWIVRERGYACDAATNAADARELLTQDSYGLVLLDINMPDEPCIELLSHIRDDHPNAAVVVIGEDDPQLATTAVERGALDYMVKPVGSGELLVNVANALYRRPRERRYRHEDGTPERADDRAAGSWRPGDDPHRAGRRPRGRAQRPASAAGE